ncbi:MAG: hypothetical protein ACI8RD_004258, partial [Bacillariaceae sp.]
MGDGCIIMHVLSEGALSATMPFVKIILTVD